MSSELVSAAGGSPYAFPDLPRTRMTAEIVSDADVLHRQVRDLQGVTGELRRDMLIRDLEARRNEQARKAPKTILEEPSDLGFAWRDIAKITGVSVAAVTKWRRGESANELNRRRLAEVLALVDMLTDRMIEEPVSWLEARPRTAVALTPMDILAGAGHSLCWNLRATTPTAPPWTQLSTRSNPTDEKPESTTPSRHSLLMTASFRSDPRAEGQTE
ncbi:hypoxia/intracellular survival transcriptional regulator MosR [Nocardia sp. NPDC004711]